MKTKLIFLLFFLSSLRGYSQISNDKQLEFPEYEWLNKKIPLDTLISYQGDTLVLFGSDKHYVICFWYSYCPPCIAEIHWLNQLKNNYSNKNIEFIAISFENKEDVDNLLLSHPFNFKLCFLSRDFINKNLLTFGYPTNLIVSNNGVVLFQKSGGSSDHENAKKIYDILSCEIEKIMN